MNDLVQITGRAEYIKHGKWKCFCLVHWVMFTKSRTFLYPVLGVLFTHSLSSWRWARIPIGAQLQRCCTFPSNEKSPYVHTCCPWGCFWFTTAHFGLGLPGPWFPNRSQNCHCYCPYEAEWCSMCENARFVLSHESFVPRAYICLLEELNINNLCALPFKVLYTNIGLFWFLNQI